jgi:hypothetical protein
MNDIIAADGRQGDHGVAIIFVPPPMLNDLRRSRSVLFHVVRNWG